MKHPEEVANPSLANPTASQRDVSPSAPLPVITLAATDTFPTAVDASGYLQASANFRHFVDTLPNYVSEKLAEHEEKTRKKIEKYLSGIEKFRADKEAHARKLSLIRQEFNNKFSLEENKQRNAMYLAEEQQLTADITDIVAQTDLARVTIVQKKEIVARYKEMVKAKAKRNIRLTALAEKLSYELEKAKNSQELEARKYEEERHAHSHGHTGQTASHSKLNKAVHDPKQATGGLKLPEIRGSHQSHNSKQASSKNMLVKQQEQREERRTYQAPQPVSRFQKILAQQYRKMTRMFLRDLDIFNLFRDSLTSYFNYVRKTQEITQADGLNGSMLFEIIHKSTQGKVGYPHLANTVKWDKIQTDLQERHMISVVYDSLKQEIKKRRKEKALGKRKFNVSWEQLKSFNPLQVMGLLVMQWTVLGDILLEWENFLNKKSKIVRKHKPKFGAV